MLTEKRLRLSVTPPNAALDAELQAAAAAGVADTVRSPGLCPPPSPSLYSVLPLAASRSFHGTENGKLRPLLLFGSALAASSSSSTSFSPFLRDHLEQLLGHGVHGTARRVRVADHGTTA